MRILRPALGRPSRPHRTGRPHDFALYAALSRSMSSFFICIMALVTRSALSASSSCIIFSKDAGMICQVMPYLSVERGGLLGLTVEPETYRDLAHTRLPFARRNKEPLMDSMNAK